jgi:hypothetical protein
MCILKELFLTILVTVCTAKLATIGTAIRESDEVVLMICEVYDWTNGLTDYENDSSSWTYECKVSETFF